MPALGHQHRATAATTNPFEENIPRISEYTAQEVATLQSRLERQLGPEYISTRSGPGGAKVHYLAAEKVINLANEVFGFNGWSSQIQNVQVDFVDEGQGAKITLGLSIIVRVTLRDGTFHEDIGYGHIENCKGKAAAFEKAKKEAATDALKRALRNFGNVLGNCLYDKNYLAKVTKIKMAPSRWDADNLHRHPEFAPIKREAIADDDKQTNVPEAHSSESVTGPVVAEFDDDYGVDLLDGIEFGEGHSDYVAVEARPPSDSSYSKPNPGNAAYPAHPAHQTQALKQHPIHCEQVSRGPSNGPGLPTPALPPNNASAINAHQPQRNASPTRMPSGGPVQNIITPINGPNVQTRSNQEANEMPGPRVQAQPLAEGNQAAQHTQNQNMSPNPQARQQSPQPRQHEPPVGFITSRAPELLAQDGNPPAIAPANTSRFNPTAESPSIRKTSGISHGVSQKVKRTDIAGATASTPTAPRPPQNSVSSVPARPPTSRAGCGPAATNFVNPASDASRKIGMPNGGAQSPLANRSSFKHPGPAPVTAAVAGTKRPHPGAGGAAEGAAGTPTRSPLADVSNVSSGVGARTGAGEQVKQERQIDAAAGSGEEAKRLKMEPA